MLTVERVSKRFGKVVALHDVNLEVARGERVALVGSNGSGKTTLLRALLGLVRVRGKISIDGFDVARHPEQALARVAYVPQIAPPLEAPVREILRVAAALRQIRVEAIESSAAELGLSVAEIAERRVRDLSGGMKQKLLAALALASDPDLLICDEPTANLDSRARERFFSLVDTRRHDRALILCSHRADDVERLVDRVIELEEGRVISGTSIEYRYNSGAPAASEERLPC
jgi:ABC-type multidrug transport system ATPase subunit